MGTIQVPLDHHLMMRLEALAVLQREMLPGLPFDVQDGARQALNRGVDQMLGELLLQRSPQGGTRGVRLGGAGGRNENGPLFGSRFVEPLWTLSPPGPPSGP